MLVVSFFGPRNGRILQARYKESGLLEVYASQIFDFPYDVNTPVADQFLRFYACVPRHGPEFEFTSDENAPKNTQQTSQPLQPEANIRKDRADETTAYVPNPGKENVEPQEDNVPKYPN